MAVAVLLPFGATTRVDAAPLARVKHASTTKRPTVAKPPKLPRCTPKRLNHTLRLSTGRTYVRARTSTGSRVWIEVPTNRGGDDDRSTRHDVPGARDNLPGARHYGGSVCGDEADGRADDDSTKHHPGVRSGHVAHRGDRHPWRCRQLQPGVREAGLRAKFVLFDGDRRHRGDPGPPRTRALHIVNPRANLPAIGTPFTITDNSAPSGDATVTVLPNPSPAATFTIGIGLQRWSSRRPGSPILNPAAHRSSTPPPTEPQPRRPPRCSRSLGLLRRRAHVGDSRGPGRSLDQIPGGATIILASSTSDWS